MLSVLLVCATSSVVHAQTWVGGSGGNVFNVAANWSPASVPSANGSLVFNSPTNANIGFNTLPYTANSLTFTSGATSAFNVNGNGGTLTITNGITTQAGSGGANFSSGINIALGASQTWTTDANVTVSGAVSGGFALTKAGAGYLVLSGNNTYSGGTTVNAGGLYLGSSNNSAAITVGGSGKLGAAFGDLTLSNNVSLANGATLGGSPTGGYGAMDFSGTVTFQSATTTLNLGHGDVSFSGALVGQANTALTVQGTGTGVAIIAGTATNLDSVVADGAGIVFGTTLPANSVGAVNGGYVSTVYINGSSPTTTALLAKITDKANFNGTLGFDTSESASAPHVYDLSGVDLSGFTNANFALGSGTKAVLTGAINTPQANYNFKGFGDIGGGLFVQSNLTGSKNIVVTSPNSGGVIAGGLYVFLQGNNTGLTGNLSVTDSAVVLDSATALPSKSISLAANSYVGYSETATNFTSFANFAASVTSYDSTGGTSIIGLDSHGTGVDFLAGNPSGTTAARTVTLAADGNINLSTNFSKIYLGTVTGVTIGSDVTITAPGDGILRLVNMADLGNFNINTSLTTGNVGSVVVGMDGSEGVVALNAAGTYTGGTTLKGGTLLVGNNTALGSGAVTVNNTTGANLVFGAAVNNITLANNIAVTGNLNVGVASQDNSGNYVAGANALTLSGTISGTGRLYLTAPTTLSGNNTYSGGTYVQADTTVTSNTGLGTSFVDLGYTSNTGTTRAILSFSGAATAPTIGSLADAKQFLGSSYGTGDINMAGTVSSLTVNQTSSLSYSGNFTGSAFALIKNGGAQLTLLGTNAGQFTSTTINAGNLAIGDGLVTTATFGGDVNLGVTTGNNGQLFFRPGNGQTISYSGIISNINSGVGGVTLNGNNGGIVDVTAGNSTFSGSTSINNGTLRIAADNLWSPNSATFIATGATLNLVGSQTIKNLSGGGNINIDLANAGGKILTVNTVGSSPTFNGIISGNGGLTKTGASQTLTLSANNTYTGGTIVSGGTLMVNGSLASSSVTVNSGAFLMGTGTLNDVILNSGATYSPGLSNSAALVTLDSLTMTSGAILNMQLGGTTYGAQYDALNISNASGSGAFNIGGGTLTVSLINSFNPVTTNSFNLFDFTSLSGTFGAVNLPSLTSGLSWDTSNLYTTGVIAVTGTAIPEPATFGALAGLAVLSLAAWRRRSVART